MYLPLYQKNVDDMLANGVTRTTLSCGNLAHASAGCTSEDKESLLDDTEIKNIAIVTAYNDMLSAHQPFATYPEQIKQCARAQGAVAQVAGGVPAMCDGVTQGQPGMELSLFSRDVIAMSTVLPYRMQCLMLLCV